MGGKKVLKIGDSVYIELGVVFWVILKLQIIVG